MSIGKDVQWLRAMYMHARTYVHETCQSTFLYALPHLCEHKAATDSIVTLHMYVRIGCSKESFCTLLWTLLAEVLPVFAAGQLVTVAEKLTGLVDWFLS